MVKLTMYVNPRSYKLNEIRLN